MIDKQYLDTLQKIHERLKDCESVWVLTGRCGMVLQGMDMQVHDIDIQTDQKGAYEVESKLSEYVIMPVRYVQSEQMRSHLGKLEIDRVQVEIIGAIQKRNDEQTWEEPVKVERYRKWVEVDGMQIPVLSLDYEYQAYLKLGRVEKAKLIRDWLQNQDQN